MCLTRWRRPDRLLYRTRGTLNLKCWTLDQAAVFEWMDHSGLQKAVHVFTSYTFSYFLYYLFYFIDKKVNGSSNKMSEQWKKLIITCQNRKSDLFISAGRCGRRIKSRRQSVIKKCTLKVYLNSSRLINLISHQCLNTTSLFSRRLQTNPPVLAWCPEPNTSQLSLRYVREQHAAPGDEASS